MSTPPIWFEDGLPHLTVSRRRLPCGLDVIVHRDDSAPMVCVSVWYRVGSSDETPERTGFAHLFEHLFKNSAHMPAKHYDVLKTAGASDANASTSADRTAYHEVVPSNELALALWLEADRMGYFVPNPEALVKQQSVVRAERRQRYEDVPYGPERFAIAAALYPEGHPHRYLTIGLHEHIQAATLDEVEAFYRTWYVPANATLVIAGDVGDDVDDLVDRYFGSFPSSARPTRPSPPVPAFSPSACSVSDRFATLRRIHRVWPGPAAFAAGEAELDIITSAWSQPGTGTLWRALVYDAPLAQRVSAWTTNTRLGGEVHVTVDLRPDADEARVRAILDELPSLPIDAAAIERNVTRREASAIWGLTTLVRRAQVLQRYTQYTETPDHLAADLARYRSVTIGSIAPELAKLGAAANVVTSVVG